MRRTFLAVLSSLLLLTGCGERDSGYSFMRGQVAQPSAGAQKVSYYAAARFAEQASFGATPELIAELQAKGFEQWIDEQFALPASQVDYSAKEALLRDWDMGESERAAHNWYRAQFPSMAIGAPDQLRLKVTWSLSQWIAVSDRKLKPIAVLDWMNLLQRVALSDYKTILEQVTTSPGMGWYLDNKDNRPKSDECPWCAPNENYARELMQLFSIGVVELNLDGTVKKDASGRPIETYTQRDVEQLAMALTGWHWTEAKNFKKTKERQTTANFAAPMVPVDWRAAHDWDAKRVMGRQFPAGQNAERDLQTALSLLMSHANTAPFVSLRLIQNLVMSSPSPEYTRRVATVFLNNGKGQVGDMKALVKAVLLDPEARQADNPMRASVTSGKVREPFQHAMNVWRGMGCSRLPSDVNGYANLFGDQVPFSPETVFSFYAPTDTASGTDILAPEQRLLNSSEFRTRLSQMNWLKWSPVLKDGEDPNALSMAAAGCKLPELLQAFRASPSAYQDYLSARFFRGAMPSTLKLELTRLQSELLARQGLNELGQATTLMQYALLSPYFGAVK